MTRDVVLFKRYWKATTFSSIVQPTIYLLAFGLGFGSLVSHVGHVRYVEYVATGVVATAVLFSSAFPGMFNTFIRWQFQRTYDALLARSGGRRGAGHRRDPVDLDPGRASTDSRRWSSGSRSGSILSRACCWCRSSAF